MKNLLSIFCALILFNSCEGQVERSMQRVSSYKEKLVSDSVSFEQFVLLGKCSCMDQIDSTNTFSEVYDQLFSQWLPLPRLLGNMEGKTFLNDYHNKYISSQSSIEVGKIQERDDVLRYRPSSILLCDRIYSARNDLRMIYKEFIMSAKTLDHMPHLVDEYLKEESVVINNNDW